MVGDGISCEVGDMMGGDGDGVVVEVLWWEIGWMLFFGGIFMLNSGVRWDEWIVMVVDG